MAQRVELDTATGHADWTGWVIDRSGVLWAPDTWRHGFTPADLRAFFFLVQNARSLERDLARVRAELDDLVDANAALEKRAAFYRKQCVLEAQLGLALVRIGG
jgi:hypothetical protein